MTRTRNDNGQFANSTDPEDILEAMDEGTQYTTQNIADGVSIPYRTAKEYLDVLSDDGRVEKQLINARTALWTRN